MTTPDRSEPRWTLQLATGLVTVLVVLAAGLMQWRLWADKKEERARVIEDTGKRAGQLAIAVADRIGVLVRSTDLVLQQARRDFGVDDARFRVVVASLLESFPERSALQLSFADASGQIVYSTLGLASPVNIRDREHFKAHLEGGDRLFISKPLLGRVSKAWTIQFSRPVLRDGRFAGVAVLSVSPALISQALAALELAPEDSITLFDVEGNFLARNRGVDELIGKTLSPPRPFMRPDAAARGIYRGRAFDTGSERSFAWQRLPDQRLVAVVGLDERTVLAPLEARYRREWIDSTQLSGLLLVLGFASLVLLHRLGRAQRETARNEARFRSLTGLSADWYWEQDADYRFVRIEGAAPVLSRLGADDHIGKTHWDLPAPNMGDADWARHKAVLDAHQPFHDFEIRRPDIDGRPFWVLVSGTPIFDAGGTFRGYLGVSRDISERKRAEEALRASEEHLRALLDGIPDRVWLKDLQGRYLAVNRSEELAHGVPVAQIIGRTAAEFRPGREASAVEKEDAAAMASANGLRYERLSNLHGTWCEIIKAPIKTARGEVVGLVGVSRDISARKAAEQALRESLDEAQALFDASTVGIVLLRERLIVRCNRRLEESHGYGPGELIGKSTRILYDSEDEWSRVGAEVYCAMGTGQVAQVVAAGAHKSGRRIWSLLSGRYLDAARPELGAVFTQTDITAQKLAEGEQQKLEVQLRQAQKMEALGTLAGGIAHDFNNVLAAILGNVTLARQDAGLNHVLRRLLDEIDKAGLRARDLVRQILTFSRQQPLERRVVSPLEVAREAVTMLRATLPKGIELVTRLEHDSPNVLADRTQLHQVLLNLCTNAWQAMAGKPGRIEIALTAFDPAGGPLPAGLSPGGYARLSVIDNGPGMDAATLERIFDPFFTTKGIGEGTGLGLAVVQGIVKSHGGAVAVESEPGRGCAFHLYFPAVAEAAAAPEPAPPPPPPGNGQRILILDDEEALMLVGVAMLERLGYRVFGTTLPAKALAEFGADPSRYDLLVTDLNMPGLSGLEVAAAVRRLRPGLPVVLASGYVNDELRAQARELDIREVIYKPHSMEELASAIAAALRAPACLAAS